MILCGKDDTDESLVIASLKNAECFGHIVRRYQKKLARYIKRISSFSDEETEDILQEVFLASYVNLADFDSQMSSFSAWLYRIARNKTIDFYRASKSKPHGNYIKASEDFIEYIAQSDEDLQKLSDKKMAIQKLQEAMEKLSKTEKEILLLRFFEEKSYLEISDILQIPTGTVSTVIHRAKEKLKKELKNYTF